MGLRKSKPAEAEEAEAEAEAERRIRASAHLREVFQPGSLGEQILGVAALLSEERFAEERSEVRRVGGSERERGRGREREL